MHGHINAGSGIISVIIPPNVDIEADASYCEGDAIADLNVVSTNGGNVEWFDNSGLNLPNIGIGIHSHQEH